MKPPFPIYLDSSMLASAKACPRQFYYEYILNRTAAAPSTDLTAGGAYAKGHQAFRDAFYGRAVPKDEALSLGLLALTRHYGPDDPSDDNPKTYQRVAAAFIGYYNEWPPETDFIRPAILTNGLPIVEFSFAIALDGEGGRPHLRHPVTLEPLLYVGRADAIMSFGEGLFIFDDKTTKQMGKTWAQNWRLRSQFTGYCWAAAESGLPVQGAIIRGAAIQKTQIKYAQAITYRPKWMIDEWLSATYETVNRLIYYWRREEWPPDFDTACTSYGGCQYLNACSAADHEGYLASTIYADRTWSPIDLEAE